MTSIQLPEISRSGLMDLFQKTQQAQRDYSTAVNATVAAHGLDPKLDHQLNLDTGILTPAAQE